MKTKVIERPAEVTTFMGGLFLLLTYIGLNISEEALAAGLVVVSLLPAVVTWLVNIYRAAIGKVTNPEPDVDLDVGAGHEQVGVEKIPPS